VRRKLAPGIELDDDPARVDVDEVHRFLSRESYWARSRSRAQVERALRLSAHVVGLYEDGRQAGLARVMSDGVIAYLADVYVVSRLRGRGFGVALVRAAVDEGPFAGSLWLLHTADAHGLYRRFGFAEPEDPSLMQRPSR
jgi:GNAT superfamily N-acetyltransferase